MADPRLFHDNPLAERQPKTDRLILGRLLNRAAGDRQLDGPGLDAAHAILVRWADLESSGRLARLKETQLQGDFLHEVFGEALGYARPVEGAEAWHLEQHRTFGTQTPDATLGHFRPGHGEPRAVVELKGPKTHPDRDRSNGRTAVDQCWDYLVNTPPECRWGIVSNIISFRLYERDATKRAYEHFSLQSLRDIDTFRRFYVLFHRKGLIEGTAGHPPRAVDLLKRTGERQREVSEELYDSYSRNRLELIAYLHFELAHTRDQAIEMAQRLFDRVMFIAFCEDRGLLNKGTIAAANTIAGFHAVTNPRWQQFKNLFRFIDAGSDTYGIPGYNGGLFAQHPVDDLDLPDRPWTDFFGAIASYDFADEVNLDVLGHLFEKSITELEKLKQIGLFGGDAQKTRQFATMPQSAKRKQLGVYYTPPQLTSRIVQYTVEELIDKRFDEAAARHGDPDDAAYWAQCLGILKGLKIVDPACGSGAFLFQAYNTLEQRYMEVVGHLEKLGAGNAEALRKEVPHLILRENLYGVDFSPEAVEITQLALWIRSATPDQTLATLSHNIVHGNSLVHDAEVDPAGFAWKQRFPEVFERDQAGFDCVIGNPPWERIKLQEREFFSLPAPEIATATNAAKRRKLVAKLESEDPALHARYRDALAAAESLLTYCRKSKQYPLTGKGDINTYAVFAELASQLVSPRGRVGLLTPSGIASDKTTKDFFAALADRDQLIRLYDFENKKHFFPEVHASFKFCILNFGGLATTQAAADFVFFAHHVEELEDSRRHVALSGDDLKLLNPNTRTCPIFRSRRDAEITKSIYRRVPVLIDRNRKGPTGNPWGVNFKRMFDQTNDAERFREAEQLQREGFKLDGNRFVHGRKKQVYLPVYEAKMVQMYDHRAADIASADLNWVRQGQTERTTLIDHQNPEHAAMPRFWVSEREVEANAGQLPSHFLCYKDVTSPTNQRTMIAAFLPPVGVVNSAPIMLVEPAPERACCLLANLNTLVYDYVIRQKIGNIHLNFFILEQAPTLAPDAYDAPCPWDRRTTLEAWISERVLKLSCTAEDLLPLSDACGFTGGSFQREYGGRLNKWDDTERAQLMAELDAAYFILYGIDRGDAEYLLSTFKGIHATNTLLPGRISVAGHVLNTYDDLCARR